MKLEILKEQDAILLDGVRYVKEQLAQKTILINGFEVPEPVRAPLAHNTQYWFVTVDRDKIIESVHWRDDSGDKRFLSKGLIHLTEEAARKHAEALLSFTRSNDE